MINDGATFIDVGAYSSRPGAAHVFFNWRITDEIIPIVETLTKKIPLHIYYL